MKLIGAVLLFYILFALTTDCHPPGPRAVPVTHPWSTGTQFQALEERVTALEEWAQREGMKRK